MSKENYVEPMVVDKNGNIYYSAKVINELDDKKDKEIERLHSIINELEKELNIAYKELQPNEMVRGQDLIKNIQITIKELKGVDKE